MTAVCPQSPGANVNVNIHLLEMDLKLFHWKKTASGCKWRIISLTVDGIRCSSRLHFRPILVIVHIHGVKLITLVDGTMSSMLMT